MYDQNSYSFLSFYKGISKQNSSNVSGRKSNGIFIKLSGSSIYTFCDKKIELNENDVLYIPESAKYQTKITSKKSEYCALNFSGKPLFDEIKKISGINIELLKAQMDPLIKLQTQMDDLSVYYKCQSILYDIISIFIEEDGKRKKSHLISRIKPSYDYLHQNIMNSDLEIEKLGQLSGVSNTYFRECFIKITGMSPKKYVTEKRMNYAKALLGSSSFKKVYELAYACGYSDPLYFSKVFKSYFHISPKKYFEL